MTDRINSLVVTLEDNFREDDAQFIIDAIRMIRGVITVEGNVTNMETHVAYAKARVELQNKLFDALK